MALRLNSTDNGGLPKARPTIPYVLVWPGLSRCPISVIKMSWNFTTVKFSKWTPA